MAFSTSLIRGVFAVLILGLALAGQTKLLRFPDIHGGRVVFSYAGDLWTASSNGGAATRLTAHPGQELFAKFSPDGKWIAFTGQYDGDEQVYVIPATGGVPKQLTYYPAKGPLPARWGYDNQVYGWTPDGTAVLFRSLREGWSVALSRLYTVPVQGGLPEALPMPTSGAGDFSPDGTRVLYSPLFRDFRTWKRYEGGWAQNLYIFDLKTRAIQPVDHSVRTERDPMWIGNKVYYASDRTGTLNLYEYDLSSKRARALTAYRDWDVRWPSASPDGKIVFEWNGELQVYDTKGGDPKRIRIDVPSDGLASRPSLLKVGGQVADFELSPKGERALFVARGDIFSAPIEKGVPRNLTRSSGAHDKAAAWSPDGRWIAFLSDMSGEEELYIAPQDGSARPTQLTSNGREMRYRPMWSPDSKKIAFGDKNGKIFVLTVADKSVVEVADEPRGTALDYVWSPDSMFLAYSLSGDTPARSLWVWSAADQQARRVTEPFFEEVSPSWDPNGEYLFYLSDREYAPMISGVEFNFATARQRSIYALALRKDVKHPYPPEEDTVTVETPAEEKKADAAKADAAKPEAGEKKPDAAKKKEGAWLKIDFDGIASRTARVPVPAQNIGGLAAVKDGLLFVRLGNQYYGRQSETQPALVLFTNKDRKENVLMENSAGWALSADGSKVMVRSAGAYHLMDVKPGAATSKKVVSTAGLMVERVPQQEWQQIFQEVWRRYRDFFYVANMHGYDWEALRQQYSPMLEYVAHRTDLNYIIGEMISELNVGHAYIAGGDWDTPERPNVALPGAEFALDAEAGRYKIAAILRGHNEEPSYRSPLTEVGVNVRVGDYVLAIDGEEVIASTNPYRLLRGKASRAVRMTVNAKPTFDGSREVVFQPVADETKLRYLAMVLGNREKVSKLSDGKLGYIHVPDMGADGIYEFIKWYYPQLRKQGMVVDMRGNGGGNVSRMLIERFRRELLATGFSRNNDEATTYPDGVFIGSLVCLLNENSASDGDIFPAMFRQAKLGPLVGKRSWGGVVGITNRGTLIDGGTVNVPEFGFASPDGKWVIEGTGVPPDIEVENDPKSVIEGKDPQLERGVQEALRLMPAKPRVLPTRPQAPVKTKEAVGAK
jgi:tricorn protease